MEHLPQQDQRPQINGLLWVVALLFAVLVLRLFYLQVTTSDDYARESEENRIAQKRIKAPRGLILDRDGLILARNRGFSADSLERTTRKDFEATTAAFTAAIGAPEIDGHYSRRHRTIRLKRDVDFRTVSIVEELLKADWPLLDIEIETQRHYPYGVSTAHLLGYMGIIRDENLKGAPGKAYMAGDFIGKTGIEKIYENDLRGRDGVHYLEVDATGRTGRQFINVANGCATGGSALFSAYNSIRAGMFDLGIAIGFDKHERGAFRVDTKSWGLGDWYGKSGMALTTQFFGMKINRFMHEHG